jgi:hypothetical protein
VAVHSLACAVILAEPVSSGKFGLDNGLIHDVE